MLSLLKLTIGKPLLISSTPIWKVSAFTQRKMERKRKGRTFENGNCGTQW